MRTVGTLLFPGFELLDAFGPLQMFGLLKHEFELRLVAEAVGPVPSNQGVAAHADTALADRSALDVLLVPGGMGTRREVANAALLGWIARASGEAEHVLGVCTGSALLANAGVLDGCRATTNKAAFTWVAEQGPRVLWQREARWVEDGPFTTSSGVSAGMDVARWAEYDWHEDAGWDPFAKLHGLV